MSNTKKLFLNKRAYLQIKLRNKAYEKELDILKNS